ncbi:hypothetical protein TrVE_jg13768 [Triparma verrucosa]|uniref:Uncharacterized protein n=1 Tax=Triparma verrucosa TaxID=1606542 RepID=A0A9W7CIQ4_9STRA|nr:hypothetical protein TrVE_jg13768 [Triparma verrucosa]
MYVFYMSFMCIRSGGQSTLAKINLKLTVALTLLASAAASNLKAPEHYEKLFGQWMSDFSMTFDKAEYQERLQIFSDADDTINLHNAKNSTFTMGHNEYSHLTWEEFRELKGIGQPLPPKPTLLGLSINESNKHTEAGPPPFAVNWWWDDDSGGDDDSSGGGSVDWVDSGAVTDVKDQGSCGSCWSFSTTGALEGAYYIANSELVAFSEQMLVECDTKDSGCNGGLMDNAFSWIQENGGLCTEEDYPYTSSGGSVSTCSSSSCTVVKGSTPSSWVDVKQSDAAMMSALDQQPVSIAIEADQQAFQLYSSGVMTGTCGTNLDHGVLAVGYGTMDGTDYYRVKNSWGSSWGDGGYIYLERGGNVADDGQCGMLMAASYPVL